MPDRGSTRSDLQWASRTAPVFVDINGDGTDDIIGHVRRFASSQGQDLVAAFDGKTLAPLWETPPAEGTDTSRTTKVIAQGGRLVMSEQRAVNLLEAETGKRLGRVPLSDSPRRLCIPPGDSESVWVEVLDGQHLLLNTRTATARPAPRAPPRCATPPLSPQTCSMSRPVELTTTCERSSYPPSDIRGFSPTFIYRNANSILVTGTRRPGTSVPMAALFQKGTKKPVWHGVVADTDPLTLKDRVPEVAELTADAMYLTYELEQGGVRLIRRDLRTGVMVWDVAIPRSKDGSAPDAVWVQGSRVYVPHWTWLDVFEADTGSLVGTLGRW
ncbi:hypothetical protein D7V88_04740 [Corallococcus terminator]|uniref:VCBS repeat-containing protein n=2 Tax=Corallococcus terminator TaxID=2316733 RepID=A0A3A8JT34_9BACT|nr:hypothetical protein D7V88_04740 [Corallococcus terminator]